MTHKYSVGQVVYVCYGQVAVEPTAYTVQGYEGRQYVLQPVTMGERSTTMHEASMHLSKSDAAFAQLENMRNDCRRYADDYDRRRAQVAKLELELEPLQQKLETALRNRQASQYTYQLKVEQCNKAHDVLLRTMAAHNPQVAYYVRDVAVEHIVASVAAFFDGVGFVMDDGHRTATQIWESVHDRLLAACRDDRDLYNAVLTSAQWKTLHGKIEARLVAYQQKSQADAVAAEKGADGEA